MSENLNRGARDFSEYDTMATADLEEILRLDAESPEGTESDTELLLYIMGVLADRRRNSGNAGKTAFEAWESFEKNYLPEEESSEVAVRKAVWHFTPWLRRSVAAVAIIVLLICIPITAEAFGLGDLWDVVARWAKETFSFVSGEKTEISNPDSYESGEYGTLQEALSVGNIDPTIIPTWTPEEYKLIGITIDETPLQQVYIAYYKYNEKELKIHVHSYIGSDPEKVEINENLLETYPYSDINFFIFSNMDQVKAIWITSSYECSIAGDISIDQLKQMIDSIGKE